MSVIVYWNREPIGKGLGKVSCDKRQYRHHRGSVGQLSSSSPAELGYPVGVVVRIRLASRAPVRGLSPAKVTRGLYAVGCARVVTGPTAAALALRGRQPRGFLKHAHAVGTGIVTMLPDGRGGRVVHERDISEDHYAVVQDGPGFAGDARVKDRVGNLT